MRSDYRADRRHGQHVSGNEIAYRLRQVCGSDRVIGGNNGGAVESADRLNMHPDPFDSLAAAARALQGLYNAFIDLEEWPEAQ